MTDDENFDKEDSDDFEKEIIDFMEKAGFAVSVFASDTKGIEEKWFVGKKA